MFCCQGWFAKDSVAKDSVAPEAMAAEIPRNAMGLPMAGFGTFQMSEEQAEASVALALAAGWRHIDSAQGYNNEKGTGKAIKACGIPRDQLFITTKVFPGYSGWGEPEKTKDEVIAACKNSVEELQSEYVDLYLIHTPFSSTRLDQWRALLELREQGVAKHIGVSNYGPTHIQEIEDAGLPLPEVNEIEFHPMCQQKEMRAMMAEKGILPIAYSSLATASGWRAGEGQGGEKSEGKKAECYKVQQEIATRLGVTEPQLLLRWGITRGFAILTKSTNADRIRANLDLFSFTLSEDDAQLLDALDQNTPCAWLSFGIPNPMEVITPLAAS